MDLMNNTIFSEEEVRAFVRNQFGMEGFIITQISNRHYRNRKLPKGVELIDVQLGYLEEDFKEEDKLRIKNIQNVTLVIHINK